ILPRQNSGGSQASPENRLQQVRNRWKNASSAFRSAPVMRISGVSRLKPPFRSWLTTRRLEMARAGWLADVRISGREAVSDFAIGERSADFAVHVAHRNSSMLLVIATEAVTGEDYFQIALVGVDSGGSDAGMGVGP